VDQHFHSPETFLENTAELADNNEIRQRLFDGFRDEIIRLADGEPEPESDLATIGPLTTDEDDGLDPVTQEKVNRDIAIEGVLLDVFESDVYDQVFAQALTSARQDVIASAELESEQLLREDGLVSFRMRGLYPLIYQELAANELTAAITQNEVPESYGNFPVATRDTTIEPVWALIRNGPNWRGLAFLGTILSFAGAVALSERRPTTAIQFGLGMLGLGVVAVVLVYLIRFMVPLLAGGGSAANSVVANYAAQTWPLVRTMGQLCIVGVVVALLGGIARLIWPDDWVYSSVSDERGIRSVKRRRGAPEPAPQAQLPAAAAVPVAGYPGYPQPYPGYAPQWQGYPPGYGPPPGYPQPYPAGPYAQPQPMPQQQASHQYASPGRPTVPVMPVDVSNNELVPPPAPPLDGKPTNLPDDAAQIVPKVVAKTDTTLQASKEEVAEVVETPDASKSASSDAETIDASSLQDLTIQDPSVADGSGDDDEWAAEKDW